MLELTTYLNKELVDTAIFIPRKKNILSVAIPEWNVLSLLVNTRGLVFEQKFIAGNNPLSYIAYAWLTQNKRSVQCKRILPPDPNLAGLARLKYHLNWNLEVIHQHSGILIKPIENGAADVELQINFEQKYS